MTRRRGGGWRRSRLFGGLEALCAFFFGSLVFFPAGNEVGLAWGGDIS